MSWSQLGFSGNPYSTEAVTADELGSRLFVGRTAEIDELLRKLDVSDRVMTVEGDNGVGKTSLIRVAAYKAIDRYRNGDLDRLFLPVPDVFQLTPSTQTAELRSRVYYAVARALRDHATTLLEMGRSVEGLGELDRWLHQPEFVGHSASVSTPFGGGGGGRTVAPSTTPGFVDHGFAALVEDALLQAFPAKNGGLVCILDNLELLQTAQAASQAMEELRDTLLNVPGLRWVAAGAQGVVRGAAASPRWNGLLSSPVDVGAISPADVADVVQARVETFATRDDPYVPVDADGFRYLYDAYHQNLREALGACIDYSEHIFITGERPATSDDKLVALRGYLEEEAGRYLDAVTGVGAAGWRVFDKLAATGGYMRPGDHDRFDYNSYQALNTQTRTLVNAQLVKAVAPPTTGDQRRRSYEVTPVGWLVYLARERRGLTP